MFNSKYFKFYKTQTRAENISSVDILSDVTERETVSVFCGQRNTSTYWVISNTETVSVLIYMKQLSTVSKNNFKPMLWSEASVHSLWEKEKSTRKKK